MNANCIDLVARIQTQLRLRRGQIVVVVYVDDAVRISGKLYRSETDLNRFLEILCR